MNSAEAIVAVSLSGVSDISTSGDAILNSSQARHVFHQKLKASLSSTG